MEIVAIALLIAWLTGGSKGRRKATGNAAKKATDLARRKKLTKKLRASYDRAHRAMTRAARDHGTGSNEYEKAVKSVIRAYNKLPRSEQRKVHRP
jgi:hypothetical protein